MNEGCHSKNVTAPLFYYSLYLTLTQTCISLRPLLAKPK